MRLDVEQATMANTLSRMARDGLIRRSASKTDKRAKVITLTDRARNLQSAAQEQAQRQNRFAQSDLSDQEQQQLIALMQRVIATMKRA